MQTNGERTVESVPDEIGTLLDKIHALAAYLRMRSCCLRRGSSCRRGHEFHERQVVFILKAKLNKLRERLTETQLRSGLDCEL